jgi:hypothetical protein
MRVIVTIVLCSTVGWCLAQGGTDIYLFDLKRDANGLIISNGVNFTSRSGYDNQPFFHPDKTLVYYAAADESGSTDIHVYDYSKGTTSRLTNTNVKEYSPTVTPDGKFISCIIQRDNGAQDLGKYPIEGGDGIVLVDHLTVGYHAWSDNETVFLFVLGDPASLHRINIAEHKDSIIANDIGRSLQTIPGERAVAFVQKGSSDAWIICRADAVQAKVTPLSKTLAGREFFAWTPNRYLLMSDGSTVFYKTVDAQAWTPVKVEGNFPAGQVTRISISRDGNKIVLVVDE